MSNSNFAFYCQLFPELSCCKEQSFLAKKLKIFGKGVIRKIEKNNALTNNFNGTKQAILEKMLNWK